MGHIQYYMNYADQPTAYREGANPGFHEAIGDLIALSVSSPEHLEKVGLLERTSNEELRQKVNLNYQLKMALEKIVFLPFAYVLDRWRWDVFAAEGGLDHALNRHWWTLRLRHQGLSPPVKRSERDFDPGAKYHIPAGVEYVRYFASHVLQFQFFEHMCGFVEPKGTGSGKPSSWGDSLYKCDFDGNKLAGASLRAMLAKGSSASWQSILKDFIGSERMSLGALRRYFTPLESFLDGFISRHNLTVGWADAKGKLCVLLLEGRGVFNEHFFFSGRLHEQCLLHLLLHFAHLWLRRRPRLPALASRSRPHPLCLCLPPQG